MEENELYLWNRGLVTLPELPVTLERLFCENNYLMELPPLPPNLQLLNCGYNELDTLPSLPDTLEVLNAGFNKLTQLPRLPQNIRSLYIENNELRQFPEIPRTLLHLNIEENPIANIDFVLQNTIFPDTLVQFNYTNGDGENIALDHDAIALHNQQVIQKRNNERVGARLVADKGVKKNNLEKRITLPKEMGITMGSFLGGRRTKKKKPLTKKQKKRQTNKRKKKTQTVKRVFFTRNKRITKKTNVQKIDGGMYRKVLAPLGRGVGEVVQEYGKNAIKDEFFQKKGRLSNKITTPTTTSPSFSMPLKPTTTFPTYKISSKDLYRDENENENDYENAENKENIPIPKSIQNIKNNQKKQIMAVNKSIVPMIDYESYGI